MVMVMVMVMVRRGVRLMGDEADYTVYLLTRLLFHQVLVLLS